MDKYSNKPTQVCGNNPHICVSPGHVWRFLKDRHPQHTEKNTAQELSRKCGADISHRTVERWRTKLPSSRHIIMMFITFPDFVRHLTAPAPAKQAKYEALKARHKRLAQGNEHGSRERWDNNEDSCGE